MYLLILLQIVYIYTYISICIEIKNIRYDMGNVDIFKLFRCHMCLSALLYITSAHCFWWVLRQTKPGACSLYIKNVYHYMNGVYLFI